MRLKEKKYKAKLIKHVYIPKEDGKERPLGIPALEDKIVQKACSLILTAIYEQDFMECSYAYRRNRSTGQAVGDLTFQLQYGVFGYIVEADIQGFFDNMDHDWILEMLSIRINDRAFLNLIRKWLKAGISERDGLVIHPDTGSPQGGIVSPIIANVYLHYALDLWFEKVVKPQIKGEAIICRYADDWVCAFRFRSDARRFYRAVSNRLSKFKLQVAPEKTQILRFSRFNPSMSNRFTFLGFEFFWMDDRNGIARVKKRTSIKKFNAALKRISEWIKRFRHLPGAVFFGSINSKLRGHYNYYGKCGNSRALWRYYRIVIGLCFKWRNRRSQRKSYNWEQFKASLKHYNVIVPRITETKRLHRVAY